MASETPVHPNTTLSLMQKWFKSYTLNPLPLLISSSYLLFVHPLCNTPSPAHPSSNPTTTTPDHFSSRILAKISLSRNRLYSSSPTLTGLPPYVGINTRSPSLTLISNLTPSLEYAPGPTARTRASLSSFTEDSGRKMPDAVLDSAFMRWTRTRSRRGARARMDLRDVALWSQYGGRVWSGWR
jgi:hypothetical protein